MSILEKVRPENCFRCADGHVLGSVYELEDKLCTMSYETFYHHVNPVRNDFYNWIRDIFHDYELANELLSAKTPAHAAAIVRKHLRKALLAKEEIENAIKTVSTAKTKPVKDAVKTNPAEAAPRKKQRKPKKQKRQKKAVTTAKTAGKKNRKLNKKHNTRQYGRKINSRGRTKSNYRSTTFLGKRLIKKRSGGKRGKSKHKRIKKQVNRWLNWLKISPEL